MFWKVFGGIVIFFMVVALAIGLLATVSVAAVGVAVGSAIDNLESSMVQVIDSSGRTETYSVNDLLSGTERLEVYGDNGELVTIDMNLPQITVQEGGKDAATVIINGAEAGSVVIDGEKGIEIGADGSHIRIDGADIGRDVDSFNNFDGGHLGRFIAGLFRAMFNLVLLSMILVGIWLLVRNQRSKTAEKTPDATA
jgi:hypothetical protein